MNYFATLNKRQRAKPIKAGVIARATERCRRSKGLVSKTFAGKIPKHPSADIMQALEIELRIAGFGELVEYAKNAAREREAGEKQAYAQAERQAMSKVA